MTIILLLTFVGDIQLSRLLNSTHIDNSKVITIRESKIFAKITKNSHLYNSLELTQYNFIPVMKILDRHYVYYLIILFKLCTYNYKYEKCRADAIIILGKISHLVRLLNNHLTFE